MVMTNRDGELVQHYGYTTFGNERYKHNSSAFSVTNRYTGQQLDEDTGLYFYNSRYYDPELARFTQADTIVPSSCTSQALNRYSYVKNNPLRYVDPSGHFIVATIMAIGSYLTAHAAAIVTGAIVGALIGAGIAAAMGGNILNGALTGAIAGACMGAVGGASTSVGLQMAGAAAGGALGAWATGGDPGMAALTAAITVALIAAAVEVCSKFSPAPTAGGPSDSIQDQNAVELATSRGDPNVGGTAPNAEDIEEIHKAFYDQDAARIRVGEGILAGAKDFEAFADDYGKGNYFGFKGTQGLLSQVSKLPKDTTDIHIFAHGFIDKSGRIYMELGGIGGIGGEQVYYNDVFWKRLAGLAPEGAKIHLELCHSAAKIDQLQALATTMQRTIKGSKGIIRMSNWVLWIGANPFGPDHVYTKGTRWVKPQEGK